MSYRTQRISGITLAYLSVEMGILRNDACNRNRQISSQQHTVWPSADCIVMAVTAVKLAARTYLSSMTFAILCAELDVLEVSHTYYMNYTIE